MSNLGKIIGLNKTSGTILEAEPMHRRVLDRFQGGIFTFNLGDIFINGRRISQADLKTDKLKNIDIFVGATVRFTIDPKNDKRADAVYPPLYRNDYKK